MDKRNLYKTGYMASGKAYVSILGFDASQGEHGHYRIGKQVSENGNAVDFNGNLSVPAEKLERLTF